MIAWTREASHDLDAATACLAGSLGELEAIDTTDMNLLRLIAAVDQQAKAIEHVVNAVGRMRLALEGGSRDTHEYGGESHRRVAAALRAAARAMEHTE